MKIADIKRIILIVLLYYCLFVIISCIVTDSEITQGDFVYKHFKTSSEEYYVVLGLSEEGKEKKILTIPSEVRGVKVKKIGYRKHLRTVGSIESKNLEILYIEKYIEFGHQLFLNCPNLEKIICLEFVDKTNTDEYYDLYYQNVINNKGTEDEEYRRVGVYVYPEEDYIVDRQNILYSYANVVYYLDKDTVYYIDFYDNEKITDIPSNPVLDGYEFIGWFKEEECINEWDFDNEIAEVIYEADGITRYYNVNRLYAKWNKK